MNGKLCAFAFGIAIGIAKGLMLMLLAWAGWLFGFGLPLIEHIGMYYHGVNASLMGGLIGGLWGLAIGFVFGFLVAHVYNFILGRHCAK